MKKSILFLAYFGVMLVFAQQITTLAEYKSAIKTNKTEAKESISPYLYDGYKTTYFNYKTFKQVKEVEIYLFNNTEYKLAINGKGCPKGLEINIYDKDKSSSDRKLLKKVANLSGQNIVIKTDDLNKISKENNPKATRLKRVFVNYVIPAIASANNSKPLIEDRGAAILVMGYKR